MDETDESAEFGNKVKVLVPGSTNHRVSTSGQGRKSSRHVTAVMTVSVSGRIALPLFIISGKKNNVNLVLIIDA